jgi:hypothetical protein
MKIKKIDENKNQPKDKLFFDNLKIIDLMTVFPDNSKKSTYFD